MSIVAPSLRGRVSRRDVALSPHVWFAVWASFTLFAVSTLIIAFAVPGISQTRMLVLTGVLGLIAAVLSRLRAPDPGTAATHAVLSLVYLATTLTVWAFAPHAAGVVVAAIFVAPLASIWLVRRRQVVAHVAAASLILFVPSLLGEVDRATFFACLGLVPAIWVLAACCVLVMEAAETQGRDLERMVGVDPLTGLGNRRSLDDQLTNEITRHSASHRPLTILTLDLNGFARFNDMLGHATGDQLLETVANALTVGARRHDIVIRLGGDEFCILLPNTSAEQAAGRVRRLRERLAQINEYGSGITAGFGSATYPVDGTTTTDLLRAAEARLRDDKDTYEHQLPSPVSLAAELASRVEAPAERPRTSAAPPVTPFDDHVTRADLSENGLVWKLVGVGFLFYALLGLVLQVTSPELTTDLMPFSLAVTTTIGLLILGTPAPPAGSLRSEAAIAATYVTPVLAFVACQPGGSIAIGTAVFVGGVATLRSTSRARLGIHLLVAQGLFFSLIPLGLVDTITGIGILLLITTLWVLSACYLLVFEAIEEQGEELLELSRRDPLTGVGNRRLLHEQLGREIPVHEAASQPMTIIALDLDGWVDVNDRLGHRAGDDLLITVASRLRAAAGPAATITRQGGDEFCVILPNTSSYEAEVTIAAMKIAIEGIEIAGVSVTAGIGAATYPFDGTDSVTLLEKADEDLLRDKYQVLDLSVPLRA